MSATTTTLPSYSPGWLRSVTFDLGYIFGLAAVALLAGAIVVTQPALFPVLVVLDLWLLGYHHVVATFTRLAFDTESFSQNRFLVLVLPVLVLLAVIVACTAIGAWVLPTTYLYWQWFHYMRQSYGIARIYQRKSSALPPLPLDDRLTKAVLYLIPTWGILYRSYQAPKLFLWMELKTVPVPFWLVSVVGGAALGSLVWWAFRRWQAFSRGQLPVAHTLYLLSHVTIFTTGYFLISDISQGWLVVNIWHNAQYILLVWMFNNNRFKAGIDPRHRFLSTISQRPKVLRYFLVCLGLSTTIYLVIYLTLTKATAYLSFAAALPLVLIAYQAINFHHYIVDAVIWKVRKKSLQAGLGITANAR